MGWAWAGDGPGTAGQGPGTGQARAGDGRARAGDGEALLDPKFKQKKDREKI